MITIEQITHVLTHPAFVAAGSAILSQVFSKWIDKILNPIFNAINKALNTEFTIRPMAIITFALKYGFPSLAIIYLMIAKVAFDKYFVFSMFVCFSVLIVSFVRDAAIAYALKILRLVNQEIEAENKNFGFKKLK